MTSLHLLRFFRVSSKDKSMYFNSDILSNLYIYLSFEIVNESYNLTILTVSSTLFKILSIGFKSLEIHLKYYYQVMLAIFHPYLSNYFIDKISLALSIHINILITGNAWNLLNSIMANL